MSRLVAFNWIGGKASYLSKLLPLLPNDAHHYVEPFGGAGAILLNRSPAPVETFNDIDGEVTHFFSILRERPDELIYALTLTEHSRDDFRVACGDISIDPIERARRFAVRCDKSIGALTHPKPSNWARERLVSRRGMAGSISKWQGHVKNMDAIVNRLLNVQIENRDAIKLITEMDDDGTLFYCDPPYEIGKRDNDIYFHEIDSDFPQRLAFVLRDVKGRVALSGYPGIYSDLLPEWRLVEFSGQARAAGTRATRTIGKRTECVWMNYDETGRKL